MAQGFIVVDYYKMFFSVNNSGFYLDIAIGMMQRPSCYQGSVAHMSLFVVGSLLDTYRLCEKAVHDVCVIACLVGFHIRHKTKGKQFRVGNIVKSKEVGTCFFYCIAIGFQGLGAYSRQQLSAAVTETFVKVGMQTVTLFSVFAYHGYGIAVTDKLLKEAALLRCFVICLHEIAYRDTL